MDRFIAFQADALRAFGLNGNRRRKATRKTSLFRASQTAATGCVLAFLTIAMGVSASGQGTFAGLRGAVATYANPLQLHSPAGNVESCPDPRIIRSQNPDDPYWYLFSTETPFNDNDRDSEGNLVRHYAPYYRSLDLVHWDYVGDVVTRLPAYATDNTFIFAPKPYYANGRYYAYFTVTDTDFPKGGSAVGVATAPSLRGPWTVSDDVVIEPHPGQGTNGANRWNYDPDILQTDNGQRYVYFGSYFGGISIRTLSADGLKTDPASESQIAIPNRYEASRVVKRNGYYYLFVSATNCCNGPLTGYSVFAGRSREPLGPFVDKQGEPFLVGRVGGTPVISMNGNRWVGPGHNDVFTDFAGHDWVVYHAIDRHNPYFVTPDGAVDPSVENKRPVLLDPLVWIDDWPTVRSGEWASDSTQFAPAAQPWECNPYFPGIPIPSWIDDPIETLFADDFNGTQLQPGWTWLRQPDPSAYNVSNGAFNFVTQNADLHPNTPKASVLLRELPKGDVVLDTRVKVDIPDEGPGYNYAQASILVYADDDNYIKLGSVAIFETRQTEFGKEVGPVPASYPTYGNTVVGPPGAWTNLRVVRRGEPGRERYTAYTSSDGKHWVRGGTWAHHLGASAKLGLVAMAAGGYPAHFDYVRISRPVPFLNELTLGQVP
ncbi:MAG TPA: family 43 glycosylhydrolase [Chthoniobacterales bacterium]